MQNKAVGKAVSRRRGKSSMPQPKKKEVIVLKKSIRILSLVMSIVMLSGIFSVFASAAKYTGKNIVMYDDLDTPVYTSDQYATMLVDYLDNMLAEMNLVLTEDDIFVGTLDVRSINTAFAGVKSLWAKVESIKSVVGDIGALDIDTLTSLSRNESVEDRDKKILYNVLDFLAGNAWLFSSYAEHTLNVGAIQTLISSYMFYIKDLAVGLLYGLVDDDYDYFDDFVLPDGFNDEKNNNHATDTAVADLLTIVVEKVLLGTWTKLNPIIDDPSNKITADMYDFDISYEENKNSYDFYGWVFYKEKNDELRLDDDWVCSSLGGTDYVAKDASAPAKVNEYLDFTNPMKMYPMLEQLLIRAYNHILVPWLNRQIINWLREECGIDGYNENTPDLKTKLANAREKNDLAKIINIDELVNSTFTARELVPTSEAYISAGGYLLNNLNNILGDLINGSTNVTKDGTSAKPLVTKTFTINTIDEESTEEVTYKASWTWESGSNEKLLPNICSLGRFILAICGKDLINGCGGPELFYDPEGFVASEQNPSTTIKTNDELVGYILRIILNDSIDFCNIPEDCLSLKEIAHTLVKQWAWVENPQIEYEDYDETEAINQILKMLVDLVAKSLNQEMDTVYTVLHDKDGEVVADDSGLLDKSKKGLDYYNGTAWTYFGNAYDPVTNNGLLPVDADTDYGTIITMLACWGVSTYGSIFDGILTLNSNTIDASKVSLEAVWQDLDTILNSLIPIKYNGLHFNNRDDSPWIGDAAIKEATEAEKSVIETIVFEYLLGALLEFNLDKVLSLLYFNGQGALAKNSIEKVIVDLVHRLFDLLFPEVFDNTVNSLDGFLDEERVPAFLYNLIQCLGTQKRLKYKSENQYINGRGAYILELAFPIVASMMELDSEQEFGELENYIPDQIVPEKEGTYTFNLYNASKGVNTSYRTWDDNAGDEGSYVRRQDNLYKYEITSFNVVDIAHLDPITEQPIEINYSGVISKDNATAGNQTVLYGGESCLVELSNLSDGMILKVITQYKVYDENGKAFMNGKAERVLTNTKYSYVGSAKDDDSVYGGMLYTNPAVGDKMSPGVLQYPESKYINADSNLSNVNGYSIRIRNREYTKEENTSGKDIVAQVTSVTGSAVTSGIVVANTDQLHMTSSKGTYSFNPVKVVEGATRDKFTNDSYDVTVNMTVGDTAVTFSFYIILYNDYGLVSLTNKAIDKNYSGKDVPDSESDKWTAYNTALEAAAKVALTPRAKGTFLTIMDNAETLATNLTNASAGLQAVLTSASAKSVWDSVNSVGAYDYTLTQVKTSDSIPIESVFYKSEIADYDVIATSQDDIDKKVVVSDYISADDYAPGSYSKFRSAKNEANDIAFDGMKVIDAAWVEKNGNLKDVEDIKATVVKPEDYDTNIDAAEAYDDKIAAIQSTYDSIVNYEAPAVSNVQASYAIAKLELTYSRLIPVAPCVDVLYDLANEYDVDTDDYTTASADSLERELAFAEKLLDNEEKTIERSIGNTTVSEYVTKPSMVKKATEKLIKAYKNLDTVADTSELNDIYNDATAFLADGCTSDSGYVFNATELKDLDVTADAWVYNYFKEFLEAYDAAGEYYNAAGSETEEAEFPTSKQNEIDKRTDKLEYTLNELKKVIKNYVEPSGDDTTWTISSTVNYQTDVTKTAYVPAISANDKSKDDIMHQYSVDYTYTNNDTSITVDKVIFGIKPTDVANAVSVLGGSVEVVGNGSSGSLLLIKDNSGNIKEACLIVFMGDNDGNGAIDSTDGDYAIDYERKNVIWEGNEKAWKLIASDVNGDGVVDSTDGDFIVDAERKNYDICQNPRKVIPIS